VRRSEVLATFDDYNVRYFGGRLTRPAVRFAKSWAYGWWVEPDERRTRGVLGLSTLHQPRSGWKSVLLHEMVHMAVPDPEVDDHGPAFTREANRVGRGLGLETSRSEAWNWPWGEWYTHPGEPEDDEDLFGV
jgi:hypothetical protein